MVAISSQKIAETIAAHIEKFILEGALRPGEKLASERELAHRLEVSRPSLREALELLVQRGLLTSNSERHLCCAVSGATDSAIGASLPRQSECVQ